MAETFRRSKIEKYIKQLEARSEVYAEASIGSHNYGKREALLEVIAELKHEFGVEKGENSK
jgi:hypothetical protein